MKNGRRGLIFKWASAVGSALVIGGGDVVGRMMRKTLCASGMIQEQAEAMRWCATGGVWIVGLSVCALAYALGAALERIDTLEMWLSSLDMAFRNRTENRGLEGADGED